MAVEPDGPLRRLGWFALLWCAGVAAVGGAAYLLRALFFAAAGVN